MKIGDLVKSKKTGDIAIVVYLPRYAGLVDVMVGCVTHTWKWSVCEVISESR